MNVTMFDHGDTLRVQLPSGADMTRPAARLLLLLLSIMAVVACGDPEPVVPTATTSAMTDRDVATTPVAAVPTSLPLGQRSRVDPTATIVSPTPSTPVVQAAEIPTTASVLVPSATPAPTPTEEPARLAPTKTPTQEGIGELDKPGNEVQQSEQVSEIPPAGSDPAEFRRAIEDLDRAIELDPDNALAYDRRGLAYSRLGDHGRAIQDFDRAVKLDPSVAVYYYNRGNALTSMGFADEALGDLDVAFELDPGLEGTMGPNADLARAYMIRAYDYFRELEEYDLALRDSKRAIELAPDDPGAFNQLCWYMSLTGRPADALPHCNRSLSLDPNLYYAYDSRGLALALLGDYEKAVEDFTKFLDWAKTQSRFDYDKYGPARERWVESLKKGENPFTKKELQAVREE